MEDDRRHAIGMGLGNVFDECNVGDEAEAFIVHYHIVGFGPIRLLVNADQVVMGIAALMHDGPRDIGARADPLAEKLLLGLVIMAAAARDEQRP